MKLWIGREVLARLALEAGAFSPLETGGVLIGWREGPDRVVVDLLGPGPKALHGRHMFLPDHAWQLAQIQSAFAASGGDLDYLGDWHTHPNGVAELSGLDRQTLRKLGRKVAGSVMLIAAPSDHGLAVGAWTQPRGGLFDRPAPASCEIVAFDIPSGWPRIQTAADVGGPSFQGD